MDLGGYVFVCRSGIHLHTSIAVHFGHKVDHKRLYCLFKYKKNVFKFLLKMAKNFQIKTCHGAHFLCVNLF